MQQQIHNKTATGQAKRIGLPAGLIAFAGMIVAPAPPGLADSGWAVAALAVLMMIWWMTEAIPLAATALAPIVFLPLLDIEPIDTVALSYAHPLLFLFLGGFLIAKALERWGLHRRISATIIRLGPDSSTGLIGSLMAATAFLSMWISNTAAAMVMVPIAQSIIQSVRRENISTREYGDFAAALMLGMAFSATIGGMATIIGTPPNALLAGYVEKVHDIRIGFGQWMLLGVPVLVVLLPITWFILTRVVFKPGNHRALAIRWMADEAPSASNRLPTGAKLTAGIVALAGLILIFRPVLEIFLPLLPLSDAGIVMTAALVLFATPARDPDGGMLLGWNDARRIRWDVLILFGGGLALASVIESSGLSHVIGSGLSSLEVMPIAVIILIAMAAMVYLGELASNTAMAAIFLPIVGAAATGLGAAPLDLVLPIGLAASLGFMLPVATPPNAIVYGSGEVSSQQMLKAGAILDVVAILIVYILTMTIGPWVFPP